MTAPNFCKTKIVATIGPSSWDRDILKAMIDSGMDVARINASFADFDELKRVSEEIRSISPRVSLILDTMGNKIRATGFKDPIELKKGGEISLIPVSTERTDETQIQVTYNTLYKDITRGSKILIDDGNIHLIVKDIKDKKVICGVENDFTLQKNKTVNTPNIKLNFPPLTEKDKKDIAYAKELKYDFVALSFVQDTEIIKGAKAILGDSDIKIISKIENQAGIDNFNEILKTSDGIMVARGDLGVETDFERVPVLQKQLVYRCRAVGKPVIVATQMLESMRSNKSPTRAEVSDVANTIIEGTDAVMLSAETSTGQYPVESIKAMNKIALATEDALSPQLVYGNTSANRDTDELCKAVFNLTKSINIDAVVVVSQTGKSVNSLSRHRLSIPIYEVSDDIKRIREDNLLRGVKCYFSKELSNDRDKNVEKAVSIIFSYGELDFNDKIAIISGSTIKNKNSNSILEIAQVKDIIN